MFNGVDNIRGFELSFLAILLARNLRGPTLLKIL
ncbi:MAG: hypothetical protein ACI9W7_001572 [Porticoccaceae bacterium]|jgi:hypothetical protein